MHCDTTRHLPWVSRGPKDTYCENPVGEKMGPAKPGAHPSMEETEAERKWALPKLYGLCLQCQHQPAF